MGVEGEAGKPKGWQDSFLLRLLTSEAAEACVEVDQSQWEVAGAKRATGIPAARSAHNFKRARSFIFV
jgi:hypothetical protein